MMNTRYFKSLKTLQLELNKMPGIYMPKAEDLTRVDLFDTLISDVGLKKTVEALFRDGHHARAVEEAYKYIDNLVKKLLGERRLSGASLMMNAFDHKNPRLRINALSSISESDEQLGYTNILAGCMTGIRNPRAHECDWEDSESRAIELLAWANHLVEKIRSSEKVSNQVVQS